MNRRTALAAAAAISLSITGLAAAAGATMHVFDAAEASPNVGKVSPVSTTTLPPAVERHVVVVDDPAPLDAPTTPAVGSTAPPSSERSRPSSPDAGAGGTAVESPSTAPPSTPTAPARPEPDSAPGHELGDD